MKTVENKRPIAAAGIRLTQLCDMDNKATNTEYWEISKALLGEENVNLWLENGEEYANSMIRQMLYKNLEVFQYADTTGEGLINRVYRMFLDDDFVDPSGIDVMAAVIAGHDRSNDLAKMIFAKMGVSPEVITANLYAIRGRSEKG